MKRFLVLGYFGYRTNQLDGQTIKTRTLYDLLKQNMELVSCFDTQDCRYNKASFFKMLYQICKCDLLCYVPAHNNLKFIFPIVFLLAKISRTKIQYFVVGGWLNEFLRNLPVHRWMLKHIDKIYPETKLMCEKLSEEHGITNTQVFPNFRISDFKPVFQENAEGTLRVVFMARVNKMKGYETVFSFADYAMKEGLDVIIDFYGPILDEDKEDFMSRISQCSIASYKGALEPSAINSTLSSYDLLVLPTRYYTEGFPGSILDAYISGIPVIVTRWKHAHEFVIDGQTGYIVPFENPQELFNRAISTLYNDRALLFQMKKSACDFSGYFKSEYALTIIKNNIS